MLATRKSHEAVIVKRETRKRPHTQTKAIFTSDRSTYMHAVANIPVNRIK
jgi:hypothetical protein